MAEQQDVLFTCVTCHVAFRSAEAQRVHFQTEWHTYNLKRKVANLNPISRANFDSKVQAQQIKTSEEVAKAAFNVTCEFCQKHYSNENSYINHLQSKKHKENEIKGGNETKSKPKTEQKEKKEKVEANLSEEQMIENKIANAHKFELNECIFCLKKSESFDANLDHMTSEHSFFIPDIEYLIDIEGLIKYLGEKISIANVCLYCNERGKAFYSLEAVQKHMLDKGHCKIFYEGDADLEFSDFYDFTSSYPDYEEGNEDIEVDGKYAPIISQDDVELTLPNGKVIGHRSLNRYYKQKFKPEDDRTSVVVSRLVSHYRLLGWTDEASTVRRQARREEQNDLAIQFRAHQRNALHVGTQSNNQRHYRRQVDF